MAKSQVGTNAKNITAGRTKKTTSSSGGSGSSGSSGSGGSGGGGGSSDTATTSALETAKEKSTKLTRDKSQYTTVTNTDTDYGAQANLFANSLASVEALLAAQKRSDQTYQELLGANQENADLQSLENKRNADDTWLENQIQLQNVNRALKSSIGNGAYGGAKDWLNTLTSTVDDVGDMSVLNQERASQNEINEKLFSSQVSAANDYNEALAKNQTSLMDAILSYLADYNSALGNTATSAYKANATTIDSSVANSNSSTQGRSTSGSNSSSSAQSSKTLSTEKAKTATTGVYEYNNSTQTMLSPYLNENGTLDYDKLAKAFGLADLSASGSSSLGTRVSMPKLQEQGRYRSSSDKKAALKKRYG